MFQRRRALALTSSRRSTPALASNGGQHSRTEPARPNGPAQSNGPAQPTAWTNGGQRGRTGPARTNGDPRSQTGRRGRTEVCAAERRPAQPNGPTQLNGSTAAHRLLTQQGTGGCSPTQWRTDGYSLTAGHWRLLANTVVHRRLLAGTVTHRWPADDISDIFLLTQW